VTPPFEDYALIGERLGIVERIGNFPQELTHMALIHIIHAS